MKVFVEVGSSAVSVFRVTHGEKELILEKKIPFAQNLQEGNILRFNEEEALVRILERISANYFNCQIEAVGTEIICDLDKTYLEALKREIYRRAKIELEII